MIMRRLIPIVALALMVFSPALGAQQGGGPPQANQFPVDDPIIKAIWDEGMGNSHIYTLAQVLA
ncbi:MAG: hypothetical protein MUO50_12130, partial [Longimicrobiales bacterium]|nr:hypothetical protein [Longimicrobiales bacterium]